MDDLDPMLRSLVNALPDRSPSKLEPHAALIRELRKKRRTYTEIAAFLQEHLQLSVAPSTLHYFIKSRAKKARQERLSEAQEPEPVPAVIKKTPSRCGRRST